MDYPQAFLRAAAFCWGLALDTKKTKYSYIWCPPCLLSIAFLGRDCLKIHEFSGILETKNDDFVDLYFSDLIDCE